MSFRVRTRKYALAPLARVIVAVLALQALFNSVSANVRVLPRSFQDFSLVSGGSSQTDTVWVEGSSLAWVNYDALKRDFPKLNEYSHAQIDKLLILNFSYISAAQLELNGIRNTPIPADVSRVKNSFRPFGYGRADIIEFLDFDGTLLGVIDRKGSGVSRSGAKRNQEELEKLGAEKIQTKDHSDGLATLGETIVETTRELARRRLYQIDKTGAETVESYFSMLFPFRILKGNGTTEAAGLYARQAHLGHMQSGFETPLPQSESLAVQQDYFGAGFDQGLIRIIDPRLKTTFGAYGTLRVQDMADWAWAHDTAKAFVESGDRTIVERHVREMLQPLQDFGSDSIGKRGIDAKSEILEFFKRYPYSQNPIDRALVPTAIGKIKPELYSSVATPEKLILHLLNDPSPRVRMAAVRQLKVLDPQERAQALERLSKDSSLDVVKTIFSVSDLTVEERLKVFGNSVEELKKLPSNQRGKFQSPHYTMLERAVHFAHALTPQLKESMMERLQKAQAGTTSITNKCSIIFISPSH